MEGMRWQCCNCGEILTEAELNNQLCCPRCGAESLSLLCEHEWHSGQTGVPELEPEGVLV